MKYNRIFWLWMLVLTGALFGCSEDTVQMHVSDGQKTETAIEEERTSTTEQTDAEEIRSGCIYVYVCGHVVNPGVYMLDEQARICDAIGMAGGVTEDGQGEALNQAEHVTDGQTVYVPGIDEERTADGQSDPAYEDDGRINLNTATKEQLMTLPGIGESKASTIIEYRDEHGAFDSIERLMEIPGIKEGVYNKIKSSIKI